MKTCEDCKFCVLADHGYSNYTVEGTTFTCGKRKHPDAPFDRFYGQEPKLEYAEKCDGFEAGSPIYMDVEEEGLSDLSPEQRKIYAGTYGTPEAPNE